MLSPGEWYKRVPKELVKNLSFRDNILALADRSADARAALYQACREDILFYINTFCYTFDPRTKSKSLPFITYPIQDRATLTILDCITRGEDLVIEKSRDMGASWLSLLCMEWCFHFHHGFTFLMVSRNADLVDKKGDPDALFWKLDYMHERLPGWLMPPGWTDKCRKAFHFENPAESGTIDGDATTGASGVGGRRSAVFIDEFSRIDQGYALLDGTADVTQCRILNFTPFGTANAAFKMARRVDVRKLRMHWTDHPEKARGLYRFNPETQRLEVLDKKYQFPADYQFILDGKLRSVAYDAEWRRRDNPREMAQNWDIDYQGSVYQFFDRETILQLQRTTAIPPVWEGDVSFDQDNGRPSGLVRQQGGPLRMWVMPDAAGRPPLAPYGAGSDLSMGTGATNSVISFVDCRTGEKVAEYASPYFTPEKFALRAIALCWLFRDGEGDGAMFAWEMQGPGVTFGKKVIEHGYRNVFWRGDDNPMANKTRADRPGWVPTNDTRRVLLEEYRAALAGGQMVNRSAEALAECLEIIVNVNGEVVHSAVGDKEDPTGAGVNHGDRVIADALAWMMARQRGGQQTGKGDENPQEPPALSLAWRRQINERRKLEAKRW